MWADNPRPGVNVDLDEPLILNTKVRKRLANVLGAVARTDHPNPIHDL